MDRLILGTSAIIIPLQIWSLWLPSNHIFSICCLGASIVYWLIFRKKLSLLISGVKKSVAELSLLQLSVIGFFFLIILSSSAWGEGVWDSIFYHYQNIRWNEEYAVVPGLGNIDDRYAFNSNYMLLSSVFTFRFLFGEALYLVHTVFLLFLSGWVFYQFFVSKENWKKSVLLFSFILFFLLSIKAMFDTSTDLLPNMIVFYLVAKIIMNSESLRQNNLLFILTPVLLITCKLSMLSFCLLSLYVFISILKNREYKTAGFLLFIAVLIVIPWLVKNVILSGYLIYPLYRIDLFGFDWKIPEIIAVKQTEYIYYIGYKFLEVIIAPNNTEFSYPLWVKGLVISVYVLAATSLVICIIHLIGKRKNPAFNLLFSILFFTLLIWFFNGPDIRFVGGIICSLLLLGFASLDLKKGIKILKPIGTTVMVLFFAAITVWSGRRIYDRVVVVNNSEQGENVIPYTQFFYKPYSYKNFLKARGLSVEDYISSYELNNGLTINISSYLILDEFPTMILSGIGGGQFLRYECLEARGFSFEDGFRSKENCY